MKSFLIQLKEYLQHIFFGVSVFLFFILLFNKYPLIINPYLNGVSKDILFNIEPPQLFFIILMIYLNMFFFLLKTKEIYHVFFLVFFYIISFYNYIIPLFFIILLYFQFFKYDNLFIYLLNSSTFFLIISLLYWFIYFIGYDMYFISFFGITCQYVIELTDYLMPLIILLFFIMPIFLKYFNITYSIKESQYDNNKFVILFILIIFLISFIININYVGIDIMYYNDWLEQLNRNILNIFNVADGSRPLFMIVLYISQILKIDLTLYLKIIFILTNILSVYYVYLIINKMNYSKNTALWGAFFLFLWI